MSIRIATVTLIGLDIDHLDRILRDWIGEQFTLSEDVNEFAADLLAKIARPLQVQERR